MDNKKCISVGIICKEDGLLPVYSSNDAAGVDLRASIEEEIILEPNESCLLPTGISLEIPSGYEAQVRPRSGLALNNKITVLNTPGTIDSDYRGEVGVILINHGKKPFKILPRMRIAQMVFSSFVRVNFENKKSLSETIRQCGGFGHTGTK